MEGTRSNTEKFIVMIDRLWECDFSRDSIRMFVNNEWKNFSTFLPYLNGYIDELKCD
jgi:hypothetical protein